MISNHRHVIRHVKARLTTTEWAVQVLASRSPNPIVASCLTATISGSYLHNHDALGLEIVRYREYYRHGICQFLPS